MVAGDGVKRPYPCTYDNCDLSFDTLKQMIRHKKNTELHDYCRKCDEDFDSFEELARHKAFRPDKHEKACRICGEEFKSASGLKRHTDMNHPLPQQLKCLGCDTMFYRASDMVEHLEFGSCTVISSSQFQGHIVHKHLVAELLKGGAAYERFMQKISACEPIRDYEEGGVVVSSMLEEEDGDSCDIGFQAIKPAIDHKETQNEIEDQSPFPPLPSCKSPRKNSITTATTLFETMSIGGTSHADAEGFIVTDGAENETLDGSSNIARREPKPWKGKSAKQLFLTALPTPPPTEWAIGNYDEEMGQEHGINILKTRFWDPLSNDWNPERFYNAVIAKYFCPFPCDQQFDSSTDMHTHIMEEHRIGRISCPSCLKYFDSCRALVAHCESRGTRCTINKADDFNIFLDKITGGFLSVREVTRPDHLDNPTIWVNNKEKDAVQQYTPPTSSYLKFTTTKPVDWMEPENVATQIGRDAGATFEYQGHRSRWD